MSIDSMSPQSKKNMVKLSLVLSSIDGQVSAALYVPILALIMQTFNNAEAVNFSFSVTSGVMVVVIFIAGHLAKKFDKRNLMAAGTAIFMLGGFLGSFSLNVEWLIATRAIEGVGAGLVYPLVPAISAQLFQGEERTQTMGLLNGGACIVSFVLNFGAGIVGATFGWRVCLYIYAILLITLFFQFKYIPKLGPDRNILGSRDEHGNKRRVSFLVYVFAFGICMFACCGMVFTITLSEFIVESGIGTTTVAGVAGSAQSLVGFIIGLAFGKLITKLGKFVPTAALTLLAVGYFGLSQATTPLSVYCSIAFVGMCPGIIYPYINECVARVSHASVVTLGMSYVSIGMLLGSFLCGFFATFLSRITDGVISSTYHIVGSAALIAAAIFAIAAITKIAKEHAAKP